MEKVKSESPGKDWPRRKVMVRVAEGVTVAEPSRPLWRVRRSGTVEVILLTISLVVGFRIRTLGRWSWSFECVVEGSRGLRVERVQSKTVFTAC
jgi:hypothetical protein